MVISLQTLMDYCIGYVGTGIQFEQLEIAKLYLFGEVRFLHFLLLFMGLDIITSLFKAWKNKEIHSRNSLFGYARKLLILVVVIVANVIDQILNLGGSITYATVLFYIASEGLSIIENLAEVGVPIPKILAEKLKHIDSTGEVATVDNDKGTK